MPIFLATWEAEIGRSWFEASLEKKFTRLLLAWHGGVLYRRLKLGTSWAPGQLKQKTL
jgi:hypothetical protein